MFVFIVVLIAIIALLLLLVVLVQSGKGGGLAGIASGGATTQILGARQAPDVLEKATWILAGSFIVLCIVSNFFITSDGPAEGVIQQRQQGATEQAAPTLPPATEQPAPAPTAPVTPEGGN